MKYILLILFVINSCAFSQWKKDYSSEVEEFMTIIEGKYKNIESFEDNITLEPEEIDSIMKKMYAAIANDPEGFDKYLTIRGKEQEKEIKEKKTNFTKPKFNMILGQIQKKLAEEYSEEFISLLKIPYFLKVRITTKTKKIYQDVVPIGQTVLSGQIEEIIKGEKQFNEGDKITFSYLETWKSSQNCNEEFEIGKSYFIPIMVFTLDDSKYEYGTKYLNDNNCAVYLVEKNIIKVPNDYFKISNEIEWSEFKKQFSKKYIIDN